MDALTLLLERQSCHALQEPGPDDAALDVIFRAALRVPDFQRLRPYRFIVAQGAGLERLGALMAGAAKEIGRASCGERVSA
jgi:nitroreductase